MSINKITYLQDIIPHKDYFVFSEYDYTLFYFSDSLDIELFLRELQIDKVYVVTFELIISELVDNDNPPVITLSKPILVTKNSNPLIISKFINNQLVQADNNFNLDYDLLINMRNAGKTVPYIIVKYNYIFASINLLNNYDDGPIRLIQLICLATFIIIVLANINLLMIRIFIL
jgi:hypothetical protein